MSQDSNIGPGLEREEDNGVVLDTNTYKWCYAVECAKTNLASIQALATTSVTDVPALNEVNELLRNTIGAFIEVLVAHKEKLPLSEGVEQQSV